MVKVAFLSYITLGMWLATGISHVDHDLHAIDLLQQPRNLLLSYNSQSQTITNTNENFRQYSWL